MESVSNCNRQIENLQEKIKFLYHADKYDLTIKQCISLLEYEPNDYNGLYYMAISYENLKLLDKAITIALYLAEKNPDMGQPYQICAHIYINLKDYKKAVEYARKAIELDPYYGESYYTLSFALDKLGGEENIKKAVKLIDKAMEIEPENSVYHMHACGLYYDIGECYRAKQEGKKAIEIDVEHAGAYLNYGCVLIGLGELHESLECFYEALKLNPNYKVPLDNIKVVKEYIENPKKYYKALEKKFFENDLKINSDSESFIILAKIYIENEDYKSAYEVFMKYFNINSHAIERHLKYIGMFYEKDAFSEVKLYLKALREKNPHEKEIVRYIKEVDKTIRKLKIEKIKEKIESVLIDKMTCLEVWGSSGNSK
ncbi:tetratricopeptide repeat protein [Clostridium felsineum]|uniref:tetratricopeptide repeat protein n=1 Tax=Clostridium felsineum TaxID=36839 RepID=UPI00098CDA5E|nr:tetratricopeptide repeat protein [Clostridium felsineum]URZ04352.1 hypothetical protein CLAUR_044410 [Clostridium felsineum]